MPSIVTQLLRHHRGYFAFATTTLAVAVGVNLVVFTIVNALWLRPLPFKDADRLVTVMGRAFVSVKAPALASFEAVAGQAITDGAREGFRPVLTLDRVGRDLETIAVTSEYFSLLGISLRGRDFTVDDDRIGAEPVAIISHRLWSQELGRRDDVIGSIVAAQPVPLRIIGVAPAEFRGARRGERGDVWIPSSLLPRVVAGLSDRPFLMIFARLPPGETASEAAQRLLRTPVSDRDRDGLSIVPLKDIFGTPTSPSAVIREGTALSVVGGLAMLVLLGGCATLSALVLVHYEGRRRDQAVKLALGASRTRLIADLAGELGLIVVGGTIGAIAIATFGLNLIPAMTSPGGVDLSRLDLSMDWQLVAAAGTLTILTLVTAAWLPIRRSTHASLAVEFAAGPTTATASVTSQRFRQMLLALHVCTIIVVLVAAGLFVRAVMRGVGHAPGFDVDRTAFVTIQVLSPNAGGLSPSSRLEMAAERTARVKAALSSAPGIDVAVSGISPIGPDSARLLLSPSLLETEGSERAMSIGRIAAGPEFLSALGIPLMSGRGLTETDETLRPVPAVVTSSLAQVLWPGENPVGRVFSFRGRGAGRHVVVGVARDFVFGSLARPAVGSVLTVSPSNSWGIEPRFIVRAAHTGAVVERIRLALRDAVPDAPFLRIETGREVIAADLGRQRLGAWFFSSFGLSALLLGIAGVFGLVAYSVESRRREFSLRLALGATPDHLVWREVAAALFPVSFGVTAGLVLAGLIAQAFRSLLVGLSPIDPLTYAAIAVTMLASAALAAVIAAWPLRTIAPAESLKQS
jgi:putative ABC transport system permease protein